MLTRRRVPLRDVDAVVRERDAVDAGLRPEAAVGDDLLAREDGDDEPRVARELRHGHGRRAAAPALERGAQRRRLPGGDRAARAGRSTSAARTSASFVFGKPVNVVRLPISAAATRTCGFTPVADSLQVPVEPGASLREHEGDVGAGERRGGVAEVADVEPLRPGQAREGACGLREVEGEVRSALKEVDRRSDRAGLRRAPSARRSAARIAARFVLCTAASRRLAISGERAATEAAKPATMPERARFCGQSAS